MKEAGEKTDEEILQEYIDGRIKEQVQPLQSENQRLVAKDIGQTINSTYQQLKTELLCCDPDESNLAAIKPMRTAC